MWNRFARVTIVAVCVVAAVWGMALGFPIVVSEIDLDGLLEIRERDVRDVLTFEVGDEVRESDLRGAAQAIYDLGWFRDVLPEVVEDDVVVFHVTEYPVVREITITGNVNRRSYHLFGIELFELPIVSTTRIEQILRREDIKKGEVLNRVGLEAALKEVIAEYNDRGYVLIAVGDVSATEHLEIGLIEGRVGGNVIDGLETVPITVAEAMIDLPLDEPLVQMDLQRVMLALRGSVYFSDVQVVPDPGTSSDEVILHWTLTERDLIDGTVSIDAIALDGVHHFTAAEAAEALGEIPAEPIDNYGLLRILESLFDLYQDAGLIMARLSVPEATDGELRVVVEEGEVSEILLSGNTRTHAHVITQNLKIEAGDVLTRRALRVGYQRLTSFGYFGSVDVLPEWSDDGVRLAVIVTERDDLGGMNGTLAVEPASGGIVGELTVDQKNLFGLGQDLSITYSRGFASEVEPMTSTWTLGYATVASYSGFDRIGLDLYRSIREISVEEGEFDEYVTIGGKVGFDYPVGDFLDLSLSFKHEEERLVGTDDWTPIDAVTVAMVFDDVDDPFFPMSGTRRSFNIEKAGGFAAGLEYTKVGLLWIQFTPVESVLFGDLDQTFAVRFRAGWADSGLSATQAFYLGGSTTVRGTVARQVPRMFISNFEYRVELTEGLAFTTFFDVGVDLDKVRLDEAIASTGFEFGVNAAGIFVRLQFIWVIEEGMHWFPRFDLGFGQMF